MSDLVKRESENELEPHVNALVFELHCTDLEGEEVEAPYVRYLLRPSNKPMQESTKKDAAST